MSSYGMCPYVFCILHSTRFWYKRCGFTVINIDIISYLVDKNVILRFISLNIDIISYLVDKNVILRFRPCWVYPVG